MLLESSHYIALNNYDREVDVTWRWGTATSTFFSHVLISYKSHPDTHPVDIRDLVPVLVGC